MWYNQHYVGYAILSREYLIYLVMGNEIRVIILTREWRELNFEIDAFTVISNADEISKMEHSP